MAELNMNTEIIKIVQNEIQSIPAPQKCRITKIYDGGYVDAKLSIGELKYIPTISNNLQIGNIGIVIYLNGGFDECIIITK